MSKKPDDAAKIAGLASILKVSNQQKDTHPSPALPPEATVAETPSPAPVRTKRDKVGKYRDPSFHHYGVYLRRDTHKRVKRRLEDTESDMDVSELLQSLLEQWLKSN